MIDTNLFWLLRCCIAVGIVIGMGVDGGVGIKSGVYGTLVLSLAQFYNDNPESNQLDNVHDRYILIA